MMAVEFGQGQHVVGAEARRVLLADGDENLGQTLFLMLARDLPEPIVELRVPTVKDLTVVTTI